MTEYYDMSAYMLAALFVFRSLLKELEHCTVQYMLFNISIKLAMWLLYIHQVKLFFMLSLAVNLT